MICPIPFLAPNDGESIGNLNYSWRQVSILRMRGLENNILSVAISLISKLKELHYRCMVDVKCQKIAHFSSAMLRQKIQHLYPSLVIIYYIVKCFPLKRVGFDQPDVRRLLADSANVAATCGKL